MEFRSQRLAISLVSALVLGRTLPAEAADLVGMIGSCGQYYSEFRQKMVGYCRDRSRPDLPNESGEPVVYFMHGALWNSRQWFYRGYSEDLKKLAKQEKLPAFTVVSFDTSGFGFFSDEGDVHTGKDAHETWFLQEFMPWAEKKFSLCQARNCRMVIGSSMGGYGALKTALRHPHLFSAAGASAGAVLPANIWAWSLEEWTAYFGTKPIGESVGKRFIEELRNLNPTPEHYDAQDPVVLGAQRVKDALRPALYFDVSGGDQFGFEDGFARLDKTLTEVGYPHETYYDPDGTHFDNRNTRPHLLRFTAEIVRRMEGASQ